MIQAMSVLQMVWRPSGVTDLPFFLHLLSINVVLLSGCQVSTMPPVLVIAAVVYCQVWMPPQGYEPLRLVWKPLGVLTFLLYLAVVFYYLVVLSACVHFDNPLCHWPDIAFQVWMPPQGYEPLRLVWKPLGVLTGLFYLAVTIYYFYVRLAFTLAMGTTSW
jgi:hypothetical protein